MKKKETFEFDSNKQETDFIKNLQNDLNKFFNLPFDRKETNEAERVEFKQGRDWQLFKGDSIKILRDTLQPESIDFAVF